MWARTKLRINWGDLVQGGLACLGGQSRKDAVGEVENFWGHEDDGIAAYSVRSGFDLLLQALNLDPGDEVLFSALNVKGMISIAKREGLQPVPVDLDLEHMAPRLDALEKAITPRSKVLVIAHLFGTVVDFNPIIELAHKHGILVVEDCAQAFFGKTFKGHEKSDVCLFSFGPLKSTTALGGAIARVSDPTLRQRLRDIQSSYQLQAGRDQFVRVLKFSAIKAVTAPGILAIVHRLLKARGKSYDDLLANPVRNIAKLGSSKKLRYQPSTAMLRLLAYRLRNFDEPELKQRSDMGATLSSLIGTSVSQPAIDNSAHSYWVFPVVAEHPHEFISALREKGFDAADLPRSRAVEAPADRPDLRPETAEIVLKNLVILPCYPGMSNDEISRLAGCVKEVAGRESA